MNPVQHAIDEVSNQMQNIRQLMASVRLAYEEAHGPGSSNDLSVVGDVTAERSKQPINARLLQNFLRPVHGEPTMQQLLLYIVLYKSKFLTVF